MKAIETAGGDGMTDIDTTAVTAKVIARKAAKEVCQLANGESLKFHGDANVTFWKTFTDHGLFLLPTGHHPVTIVERGPLAAMTDAEAKKFERDGMPFGKWAGNPVGKVPLEYLVWLDEQDDFHRQLNRYLRNEQVQRMQGERDGD